MKFADEATALRGLLASGVAERAIRNSGEAADPLGHCRSDPSITQKRRLLLLHE